MGSLEKEKSPGAASIFRVRGAMHCLSQNHLFFETGQGQTFWPNCSSNAEANHGMASVEGQPFHATTSL
jgi:hypothetical protein